MHGADRYFYGTFLLLCLLGVDWILILLLFQDRFLSGFFCPRHKDKETPCDGLLILPEDVTPDRDAVCTAGCGQSKPEGELSKALKRVEVRWCCSSSWFAHV